MSDLTPLEKLQPCLLDRLTDDEPDKTEESRNQRVISQARYKRGVLRDLEWLFSASAHLPHEGGRRFKLSDYPEAYRSILNYGTRHLCGMLAPNMDELERELADALRLFEPRIIDHSLNIKATVDRHLVTIEITGD